MIVELGVGKTHHDDNILQDKKNKYNNLADFQKMIEEEAKIVRDNKRHQRTIRVTDKMQPRTLVPETPTPTNDATIKEESKTQSKKIILENPQTLDRFNITFPPKQGGLKRRKSVDHSGPAEKEGAKPYNDDLAVLTLSDYITILELFRRWYSQINERSKVDDVLFHLYSVKKELESFKNKTAAKEQLIATPKGIKTIKLGVWGELWESKREAIKEKSPFGHFPSYKLKQFMVKGGDDLRQELLVMQIIYKFQSIWKQAGLPLKLRPYEIIVASEDSGFLGKPPIWSLLS
mgnify:CR=1 FL=1